MIPIAQLDPTIIADGLGKNPLLWIATLSLLVNGWMFRTMMADKKESAAALLAEKEKSASAVDAANRAMVEALKEDQKEQKQIMGEIIPLAGKLVDAIETVNRVADKLTARGP